MLLRPTDGGALTFPSGRRVVGEVTVSATQDGLAIVNDLPLEDYVRGIAEMPSQWPSAALEAQAVAARTYAWYQHRSGVYDDRGYDICATTACQVYDGVRQVEGLLTADWDAAVEATEGQVLVDEDGYPALTRYFSTSGGRTRDNAVVFPETGDIPYLRGVDDPDDAIAPLHTWQVTFTRDELDAILARGDQLEAASPMASIEAVPGSDGMTGEVVVRGVDGTEVRIGAATFRTFVGDIAPALFPERFPGTRSDGRQLPSTLPSSRVTFTVTDDQVVVDGSGWGHAVGMGQWGARGKAERGLSSDEILAAYYGGLEPTTPPELPERIRVGLGTREDALAVRADIEMEVVVDGRVVTESGHGTFTIAPTEMGLRVNAPPGWREPLDLADPVVDERVDPGRDLEVRLDAGKPARLDVSVAGPDGTELAATVGAQDGLTPVLAVMRPPDGGWPEGQLRVDVEASDETGATATTSATVEVGEPPAAEADARTDGSGPAAATGPLLLFGILSVVGVVVWLIVSGGEAARTDRDPGGARFDGGPH